MLKTDKLRILVVDDEEDICEIIKYNLEAEGFIVDVVSSAEEALKKKLGKYQLFLLDIMMKGMSGFRLADEIKKQKKLDTPIIFISAKNTENDKLTGFSIGADDYITKPFSVKEIIARVKAVIRRTDTSEESVSTVPPLKIAGIELDIEQKRLYVDGIKKDLTPIEFQLLHMFLKNKGKICTRDHILNLIWRDINVTDRTMDVHINRLRKKLGSYGKNLVTRKGYGYYFEIE